MSLILHCGAKPVDEYALARVETPQPTRSHFPVPHFDFFQLIVKSFFDYGLELRNIVHGLTKDGARYFGLAEVVVLGGDGWATMAGWRSSHDKSVAAALVHGGGVFVCDNLMLSGEHMLSRKHTRYIMRDLPPMIDNSVAQTRHIAENTEMELQRMKRATIPVWFAHHTLVTLHKRGVLTASRLGKAIAEYETPSHPEHGEGTVWTLYNAVTEALKTTPQSQAHQQYIDLHKVAVLAADYAEERWP